MSDNNYTLRIWLYPFSNKDKGYHISEFENDSPPKFVAVLSQKHLDILINEASDENEILGTDGDKFKLGDIKLDNVNSILIFQHTSTANEKNTETLNKFLQENNSKALLNKVEPIANGSKETSNNYAAMHDAVELYNKCVEGGELKEKGERVPDISNPPLSTKDTFKPLADSEPESSANWVDFFENINGCETHILDNNDFQIWAFSKKAKIYQLVNLNRHYLLFRNELLNGKGEIKDTNAFINKIEEKFKTPTTVSEAKLNIILAPYDLNMEAGEQLLQESIKEKVFNIDDSDSTEQRKSITNIPLLLICKKAGDGQLFYNASIWTRMVVLDGFENGLKYKIKETIGSALDYLNQKNELHQLEVAREFLDFHLRLFKNAYLTGSHRTLLPINFHNEELFKEKYEKDIKQEIVKSLSSKGFKENDTKDERLKFNILLIDDYSSNGLKYSNGECSSISKESVLEELNKDLKYINFEIKSYDKDFKIDKVIEAINSNNPDIILLDYNLGPNSDKGSKLFESLLEKGNYEKLTHKGPFDKLWVFPITSFSNAFIDDLRNKGIGFIDEKYKLSRGTDFINTPNLFLYYFSKMVKEIVDTATETHRNIEQLIKDFKEIRDWKDLKAKRDESFKKLKEHYTKRQNINFYLEAKEGIVASFSRNDNDKNQFLKQLNFYEQLLYNLAYRNYEGNEEILIFYDLLDKELKSK